MGRARHAWAALRRHPVRVFCVVALGAGVLVILVAYLFVTSPSSPSFQFLGGQKVAFGAEDQDSGPGGNLHKFYSFAGDFQSVCEAARLELTTLGYTEVPQSPENFFPMREFRLHQGPSNTIITVRILGHAKLMVFSTPKGSQYSSPDRYNYRPEDGWVLVEVHEQRGATWLQRKASRLLWRMGLSNGK